MRLSYYRPSISLQNLVSFFYVFETGPLGATERLGALLGQLQFRLAGNLRLTTAIEGTEQACATPIMGPSNSTLLLSTDGPMVVVGCGFLPAGWSLLVRASAFEMADRIVDAYDIWGLATRVAWQRAGEAKDDVGRVAALDDFLCNVRARTALDVSPRILTIDQWLTRIPQPSIDELVHRLDISQRQVERCVASIYGSPPKLLALKYLSLRASYLLATGQANDWLDAGGIMFADQSHFIRNFKRFTGQAPGVFSKDAQQLSQYMLRSRWLAGARSPLALWS